MDNPLYGCRLNYHNQDLIKVLDRFHRYNHELYPQKCCFLRPKLIYLDHPITKDGVRTDPSKYEIVHYNPIPKTTDEDSKFVAFCNY